MVEWRAMCSGVIAHGVQQRLVRLGVSAYPTSGYRSERALGLIDLGPTTTEGGVEKKARQ